MDQGQPSKHLLATSRNLQQYTAAVQPILAFSDEAAVRETIGQLDGCVVANV